MERSFRAFSASYDHCQALKVDILNKKPEALREPKTSAIQRRCLQTRHASDLVKESGDLGAGQHDG